MPEPICYVTFNNQGGALNIQCFFLTKKKLISLYSSYGNEAASTTSHPNIYFPAPHNYVIVRQNKPQ